jgi:hypothetical protein
MRKKHKQSDTQKWLVTPVAQTDEEWTSRIAELVWQCPEVEEIERHADCPERICKNEFFFYNKYSDAWPSLRVVVEPVVNNKQESSKKNKYVAQPVRPGKLADDELLPEIVNIWRHGERGAHETGEGLFGWLCDQGHIVQIEKVINEYCSRQGLK